jgi:hypothetical protein
MLGAVLTAKELDDKLCSFHLFAFPRCSFEHPFDFTESPLFICRETAGNVNTAGLAAPGLAWCLAPQSFGAAFYGVHGATKIPLALRVAAANYIRALRGGQ